MSPDPDTQRAPLAVDELARVVLELAAEQDLAALIARFTECVRAWAAPSALVAAARGSEPGSWRVLPALSFGSLPLGIERALQQLVDDVPECLARPAVQQPLEPVAGVKLRDNWIVPWWCEGESGLLLLRGVPRPWPPNLGEALALVSAPVWPRLLGGPAARVESLVAQLQQLSGRLQLEAGRELERLQAAAAAAAAAGREADAPPAADPAEVSRLQEEATRLEQELRAATDQLNAANEQQRSLNEQRQAAADEAAQLREHAAQLQEQAALLQQQAARQAEENAALVQRLHGLEEQRGTVRVAEARARVAEEALAAAQEAIASHAGVLRHEREAGVARMEEHRRALEAAEQRALDGEQELAAARKDLEAHSELLDAERAAVEREQQQRQESEAAVAALRQASESLRVQLQAAQAALAAAEAQLEPAQAELAAARAELAAAQGRAAAEQERARSADETLAVVRTALVSLHRSAFVPSGLRFALEDVSAAVGSGAPRRVEGMRLVILDRDLGGLESLASELEAGGLDVRIANYPEELALLLRTPGGRDVVAAICDVMAFRPDQNIAGLFRSWEKDRPGLAFFLSYDADSSVELERARRVPLSLTLAHLPRPLPAKRVGEAIELLARRQARP